MFLIIFFFIIISVYFFKYQRETLRFRRTVNKFDGPKTIPFFGNINRITGSNTENFSALCKLAEQFPPGKPLRFWLFHIPIIAVRDPEDLQIVARVSQKPIFYSLLTPLLGDGLLTTNGEKWKRNRLIIEPMLNTSILSEHYLNIFIKCSSKLLQKLRETEDGQTIDFYDLIFRNQISSIFETLTGDCGESAADLVSYFREGKFTALLAKRLYSPWLYPNFMFRFYLRITGNADIYERFRATIFQTVLKRKELLKKWENSADTSEENDVSVKGIIGALTENPCISNETMCDEVSTLFLAGTETTGVTICLTLFMLAQKPEIQERVWQEMQDVFGNTDRAPTVNDLSKMKFLEQCIKETLRLFSTIPLTFRQTVENIQLKDGNTIPAGATICIFIHDVHHDPRFYPNPNEWNPHNFDPDKVANRHYYTYIPFNIGSRACVVSAKGMKLELEIDFVTKSKNGFQFQLCRRKEKIT